MAVSPDGKTAVTTSETTNMAHWIDVASLTSEDATPVGQRPRHAEFTLDGSKLWVSSEVGGTVAVIDVATDAGPEDDRIRRSPASRPTASSRSGMKLTRDGKSAFVALGPSDRVAVLDATTYEVLDYTPGRPPRLAPRVHARRRHALTTNGVSGDVTMIDVASRKAVKSIKVGRFPWGAAVRPDGRPVAERR